MTATILDGKALAARVEAEVAQGVATFAGERGIRPCLATVVVGDDPASAVYVKGKLRACGRLGIDSRHIALPAGIAARDLAARVGDLSADPLVHGILLQLPLPAGIDAQRAISAIDPAKDVDGLHPHNLGCLALRRPGFVPCTPLGVMRLLRETGVELRGLRATVIGRSPLVGLPVALLLMHANATVRVVHSRTRPEDLAQGVQEAEVLVAAVGQPGFVQGDLVRPGAIVIDVGINSVPSGAGGGARLVGDVAFEQAAARASWITPVPGGVGPMTVAMLLSNTLDAALRQAG